MQQTIWPNIYIFANCHGNIYRDALVRAGFKGKIEHTISYENLDRYDELKNKFENADILIIQPATNYPQFSLENIKRILKKNCLIICIPFYRFDGFWPSDDSKELTKFSSETVMFFPKIDSIDKIQHYLTEEEAGDQTIKDNFDKALSKLKEMDSESDVSLYDFFLENYKTTPLLRDPYHWTAPVYAYISNQVTKKISKHFSLDLNIDHELNMKVSRESGHFKPIKNSYAKALGLNYDLDGYFLNNRYDFLYKILSYEADKSNPAISNLKELEDKVLNNKSMYKKKPTITRIFIVTPSFNSELTISRTISSISSQAGEFEIYYHIQDGGSTDKTIDIIEKWKSLLESGNYPLSCKKIIISYESVKDKGMYDAIVRGFSKFEMNSSDWMGWINSDDYFQQGAFSFLNILDTIPPLREIDWITPGTVAIANNSFIISGKVDRPITNYLLREGVCDGTHWEFMQQEGTFFRRSLWEKIDVNTDLLPFKYAGDWNLWRVMAKHARVYQTPYSLGVFNVTEGQISAASRDAYLAEIEQTIPSSKRYQSMIDIEKNGTEVYSLNLAWNKRIPEIQKKDITKKIKDKLDSLQHNLPVNKNDKYRFYIDRNIFAYDAEWQYPAITEKHAFLQIKTLFPKDVKCLYIGFPWATLIDLLANQKDASALKNKLYQLIKTIPASLKSARIITVCQHILAMQYQDLFESAGVTDIFWSHAVRNQASFPRYNHIRIHPFPLYPVQVVGKTINSKLNRDILFSFVGAKANPWYLTEIRTWIIDYLSNDSRGLIVGRKNWHYEKIVYDVQIKNKSISDKEAIDQRASIEFQDILSRSIFSLCPSGSGPNSIRLWESIGMGTIPVILSDSYLPPGNMKLWEEAAIFCPETKDAVRSLPDILAKCSLDTQLMERKRRALKQLWVLYGPSCFIYDIQKISISNQIESIENEVLPSSNDILPSSNRTKILHTIAGELLTSNNEKVETANRLLEIGSTTLLLDSEFFTNLINEDSFLKQAFHLAINHASCKQVEKFKTVAKHRKFALDTVIQ